MSQLLVLYLRTGPFLQGSQSLLPWVCTMLLHLIRPFLFSCSYFLPPLFRQHLTLSRKGFCLFSLIWVPLIAPFHYIILLYS